MIITVEELKIGDNGPYQYFKIFDNCRDVSFNIELDSKCCYNTDDYDYIYNSIDKSLNSNIYEIFFSTFEKSYVVRTNYKVYIANDENKTFKILN
jgi:hypothetical protein